MVIGFWGMVIGYCVLENRKIGKWLLENGYWVLEKWLLDVHFLLVSPLPVSLQHVIKQVLKKKSTGFASALFVVG
ncbi:MAG: hypothetical protein ACOYN4_06435 [Bacteroidales bacterium]